MDPDEVSALQDNTAITDAPRVRGVDPAPVAQLQRSPAPRSGRLADPKAVYRIGISRGSFGIVYGNSTEAMWREGDDRRITA